MPLQNFQVVIISVDYWIGVTKPAFLFSLTIFPPVQKFCIYFQEACFFVCGENLSIKGLTYLTNSLFDYEARKLWYSCRVSWMQLLYKVRACIFELNSRLCWVESTCACHVSFSNLFWNASCLFKHLEYFYTASVSISLFIHSLLLK